MSSSLLWHSQVAVLPADRIGLHRVGVYLHRTNNRTADLTSELAASDSQMYSGLQLDWIAAVGEIIHSEGLQSLVGVQE
jgi:hypothetical protein